MAQETKRSQTPLLCSTGCGFYGSPRNNGMCSVCYKDFLQRQNSSGCVSPSGLSTSDSVKDALLAQSSQGTTDASPADTKSRRCSAKTTEAPATSKEENTSGTKNDSLTDDNLIRATAIGSEQESQCSAGVSSPQRSVLIKQGFHKDKKRKQEDPDEKGDVTGASGSEVSVAASAQTEEKPKATKKRCFTCRKKVGLTGFDCRCGNMFCSTHRYSDVHNCTFNYKADAAEKIRKENPVIVAEKVQKI